MKSTLILGPSLCSGGLGRILVSDCFSASSFSLDWTLELPTLLWSHIWWPDFSQLLIEMDEFQQEVRDRWSEDSKDVVGVDTWSCCCCGWRASVHKGANWHNDHGGRQGCPQVLDPQCFWKHLDELKIRCGVDSPASGPMQWTKDGFALGLDRSLPGWPNYSMLEDKEGTSSEAWILFYKV